MTHASYNQVELLPLELLKKNTLIRIMLWVIVHWQILTHNKLTPHVTCLFLFPIRWKCSCVKKRKLNIPLCRFCYDASRMNAPGSHELCLINREVHWLNCSYNQYVGEQWFIIMTIKSLCFLFSSDARWDSFILRKKENNNKSKKTKVDLNCCIRRHNYCSCSAVKYDDGDALKPSACIWLSILVGYASIVTIYNEWIM